MKEHHMAEQIISPIGSYVYTHRKAVDGSVFYVGKGTGNRAWDKNSRNRYWRFVAEKHGYTVHIEADGLLDFEALDREVALIKHYREKGVRLVNQTDGGDGVIGRSHDEETRRRIGLAGKGRRHTEATKAKIGASNSARQTGMKRTEAHRAAISAGGKGKSKSAQTIENMRAYWKTPEGQEKKRRLIVAAHSESASAKRSASVKRNWEENPRVHERRAKVLISRSQGGRAVVCIETGVRFEMIADAVEWLKSTSNPKAGAGNVTKHLRGEIKSCYGYRWRYAD